MQIVKRLLILPSNLKKNNGFGVQIWRLEKTQSEVSEFTFYGRYTKSFRSRTNFKC